MKRHLILAFGLVIAGGLLGGCAESTSATTVDENGGVIKVITVREGTGSATMNMSEEPVPLAAMIKLEGEGWTVKEDMVNDARVFTAEKRFSNWKDGDSGWSLILSDKKSITGQSRIYESDGALNFEEKYSYVGEVDQAKKDAEIAKMSDNLKNIWMKGTLSDADADNLSKKIRPEVNRILFGPSDPILPLMLTSPKRFEREFRIRASGKITALFVGVNGMTSEEAKEQTKKFFEVMNAGDQIGNPADNPEEMGAEEDSNQENSFSISVSFKGAGVTEQNGLIDPVTDEVYWDFYSMAVEEAPVILKARFRR